MKQTLKEILDLAEWGMAILFIVVVLTSLVIWVLGQEALRVSIPILVYVLVGVGCLAAVYWLVTFVIGRWYGTRATVAEKDRDRVLARNEARLSDISIERSRLHLEIEAAAGFAQLGQMRQGMVYASALGESSFASHTKSIANMADGVPLLTEPQPDLLPAIINLQNVLVVGGKGSGKTTLLQWIEAARVRQGKVIVLDSHTQPSKWQGQVVGIGRNYKLIKNAMVSIVEMLHKRYQVFSRGQSTFEPVTTFIDEFTMLPKTLKDALGYDIQSYSVPVLTEGRKVAIAAVWGIHSDRAKIMGLEGMSDLKECFDAIVRLVKIEGRPAYALVDFGEGVDKEVHYQLPGPFIVAGQAEAVDDSEPMLLTDDLPTMEIPDPDPTPRETIICDMFDEGASFNQISKAINEGRTGGPYNDEIKSTLAKYGKLPV